MRQFLISMLLVAMPLQNQAVASTTCHKVALSDHGSHLSASSLSDVRTHASTLYSSHPGVSVNAADSSAVAFASLSGGTCAICAACCLMACVFEAQAFLLLTQASHQPPSSLHTKELASITLEGLLRPPRL